MLIPLKQGQAELSEAEGPQDFKQLTLAEVPVRREIHKRKPPPSRFFGFLRFCLTFLMIFSLIFVGLNFSSYFAQAKFLFQNLGEENATSVSRPVQRLLVPKQLQANLLAGQRRVSPLPKFDLQVSPPKDYLIIPSLQLAAPIQIPTNSDLDLTDWEAFEEQIQVALRDGVVLFPGTAEPGTVGNTFITGHSSYYPFLPGNYKGIFALLPRIDLGAEIIIWYKQQKFTYTVTEKTEVQPSEVEVLARTVKPRLTLMTCTPVGTTLRRLIVRADLNPGY